MLFCPVGTPFLVVAFYGVCYTVANGVAKHEGAGFAVRRSLIFILLSTVIRELRCCPPARRGPTQRTTTTIQCRGEPLFARGFQFTIAQG